MPARSEPIWLDPSVVLAVHDEQLAEHGGISGARDQGLLESALARPRNQYTYAEGSIQALAAAYAYGVARNHPFLDGNKRTSLVVAELFLNLNGLQLLASDEEASVTWLRLAADELSEKELEVWIENNSTQAR